MTPRCHYCEDRSRPARTPCGMWLAGLTLLACMFVSAPSGADTARPTVGLVLSGGGARGAAHIGVLKELEAMHIPVDFIAGTSMGAAIGGLYASGMSVAELESIMLNMDWADAFTDEPPRGDLPFRRKEDDRNFLVKFEFGFRDGQFYLPEGLVAGHKLNLLLRLWTLRSAEIKDFDQLPIPFRAVATDIETGEAVILKGGDIAAAIRASMAVPSAFAPVEISGRKLVDGGISNNLPIDVARAMGADVVIVVDIGSPLKRQEELGSVLGVSGQVITILTRQNTQERLALLRPADILIVPELGEIGSTDFAQAAQAITAGVTAARAKSAKLRRYAVEQQRYDEFLARQHRGPARLPRIDAIRVENDSGLSDAVIRNRLGIRPGETLEPAKLSAGINDIYGLGNFARIDFVLARQDDQTNLTVIAEKKPWGPDYLRVGLNMVDDFEGDSSYNVLLSYLKTDLNSLGAELRNEVQIGTTRRALTEWFQPLDSRQVFFVVPQLEYRREVFSLYDAGARVGDYEQVVSRARFDVGAQLGNFGEVRTGVARDWIETKTIVGDDDARPSDTDRGGYLVRLSYDRLDNAYFPHRGAASRLEWFAARTGLGAEATYDKIYFEWLQALTYQRHTLLTTFDYGTSLDTELPVLDRFALGGLWRLSGYREQQLRGQYLVLGRLIYFLRLGRRPSTSLASTFYLGASAEAGNVWDTRDAIGTEDLIYAGSLFAGMDTIVGPLYLAYGVAEELDRSSREGFYLRLGRTF